MAPNPLIIKLLCLLSIFSVIKSCNSYTPGIWINGKIESGKREDFHALNDQLLKGLKANNPREVEAVMSKDMIEDNGRLRQIELCGNRLKEGDYKLLDEYYVVHKDSDILDASKRNKSIKKTDPGINSYSVNYTADTREMYIAFFIPKSIPNKYMISAVYCKYSYGWKLSDLEVYPYASNGKTAPELFKEAKEMYDKKYLLDALNDVQLALTCAKPYNGWQYADENEMGDFHGKVIKEINMKYVYPFTLTAVPTHPRIFSIDTKITPEGVFPLVYYRSTVKLSDAAGLQKENDNIKKVIGKLIPGIDQNKEYVYYDAFNEWPRSDRSVDRVDFIEKLK
jgi:hypothetical protein